MSDLSQPWERVAELVGHYSWIYGVPITPNGQTLASVSGHKILLWVLKTQQLNSDLEVLVLMVSFLPVVVLIKQ